MKRGAREAASLVAGVSGVDVCLVREHLVVRLSLSLFTHSHRNTQSESERVSLARSLSRRRSHACGPASEKTGREGERRDCCCCWNECAHTHACERTLSTRAHTHTESDLATPVRPQRRRRRGREREMEERWERGRLDASWESRQQECSRHTHTHRRTSEGCVLCVSACVPCDDSVARNRDYQPTSLCLSLSPSDARTARELKSLDSSLSLVSSRSLHLLRRCCCCCCCCSLDIAFWDLDCSRSFFSFPFALLASSSSSPLSLSLCRLS